MVSALNFACQLIIGSRLWHLWSWLTKKSYLNLLNLNQTYYIYVQSQHSFWILWMIFCLIAHSLCIASPFVTRSIVKQCWSVGYVSLLTFSFIPSVLKHWKHVVWSFDFDIYVRQDTFLAFAIKDVPLHTNLSKTRQHSLVLDRSNKIMHFNEFSDLWKSLSSLHIIDAGNLDLYFESLLLIWCLIEVFLSNNEHKSDKLNYSNDKRGKIHQIVDFLNPRAGVLVLRCGHVTCILKIPVHYFFKNLLYYWV